MVTVEMCNVQNKKVGQVSKINKKLYYFNKYSTKTYTISVQIKSFLYLYYFIVILYLYMIYRFVISHETPEEDFNTLSVFS